MLTKQNTRILEALLKIGCHKQLVAMFLEMEGCKKAHWCYMAGPIVVFDPAWSNTMPEWIYSAIATDRLQVIVDEAEQGAVGNLATPIEVMAYMYSRTMSGPLSNDWSNIYLWCGQHVLSKHQRLQKGQQFYDVVGLKQPLVLSQYEKDSLLRPLQIWLRQKIVEAARSNLNSCLGSTVSGAPQKSAEMTQAQTSLFDFQK